MSTKGRDGVALFEVVQRKEGEQIPSLFDAHDIIGPIERADGPFGAAAQFVYLNEGEPEIVFTSEKVSKICARINRLGNANLRMVELTTSGGFHIAMKPTDVHWPAQAVSDPNDPEIRTLVRIIKPNGSFREVKVQETTVQIRRRCEGVDD